MENSAISEESFKEILNETTKYSLDKSDLVDEYTGYDKVFLICLTLYVIFLIYVRAKTHFDIDYPENETSFFSLVTSYRRIISPAGSIDRDLRRAQDNGKFGNEALVALANLLFSISLFNFEEVFGTSGTHIEDMYGLMSALIRYFLLGIGILFMYDLFLAPPYYGQEDGDRRVVI